MEKKDSDTYFSAGKEDFTYERKKRGKSKKEGKSVEERKNNSFKKKMSLKNKEWKSGKKIEKR